ncbi:glycine cleavage system protein GcvH [Saccharopolyspora tripterygii]
MQAAPAAKLSGSATEGEAQPKPGRNGPSNSYGASLMSLPANLSYTEEHEWIEDRGEIVRIGITEHAASALGDIVFVQLPDTGDKIESGQACGELESTKSVSDLFAPVTGEVVTINESAVDDPAVVNSDPYGEGWLIEVRVSETGATLTAQQYAELINE